jgi:CRP/FNR family cyclic AMP-dependent transcriptional regulator
MNVTDEVEAELKKIPWFQELKPEHLKRMSEISSLRRVKAGEVLFREGDKQDYMYIVLEGRVALDLYVPHRGKVLFYTAEEWEVFGWSGVTPTVRQRTAGAMAVIDSLVVAIDAARLQELCDQDHDLGYLFMRRMTNIIASRLMITRLQLLDMFAEPPVKVEE